MTTFDPTQLQGTTAVGPDGDKIGAVKQVYVNDTTNEPEWVTVSTGLFGKKESFAPLSGSRLDGDNLVLSVTKDVVKGAPNIDDDGHTGDDEQAALYDYYSGHLGGQSAGYTQSGSYDQGNVSQGVSGESAGYTDVDRSQSAGVGGDETITRSEERVRVGTERVEAGRARIRKYVVTENVTQTVPVSHEEIRVERVPVTDGTAVAGDLSTNVDETEHEVTLHAERPVVAKETVPVEQIRVGTETVTEQQAVNAEVRKERIDIDDATTTGTVTDDRR
jgi:uncharacterized protein (TIGR02271 family)